VSLKNFLRAGLTAKFCLVFKILENSRGSGINSIQKLIGKNVLLKNPKLILSEEIQVQQSISYSTNFLLFLQNLYIFNGFCWVSFQIISFKIPSIAIAFIIFSFFSIEFCPF